MIMDTAAILVTFRAIAPEFTAAVVSDESAIAEFSLVADFVSESKFGPFYNKAIAVYAAHLLKLNEVAADDGSSGGTITAGGIIMEKEGDLQRQYGTSASTSAADISIHRPHTRPDAATTANPHTVHLFQFTGLIRGPTMAKSTKVSISSISIHRPHTRPDR